jgi:hypothetical protein
VQVQLISRKKTLDARGMKVDLVRLFKVVDYLRMVLELAVTFPIDKRLPSSPRADEILTIVVILI